MRRIPLTQGQVALVDDEDYDRLIIYKWHAALSKRGTWYVETAVGKYPHKRTLRMHQVVMMFPPRGIQVDHVDGDGLNNQKTNLRICTNAENSRNSRRKKALGFKGVWWHKAAGKYAAAITVDRKSIHLGLFADEREAAIAYNDAASRYFGEFARLNIL